MADQRKKRSLSFLLQQNERENSHVHSVGNGNGDGYSGGRDVSVPPATGHANQNNGTSIGAAAADWQQRPSRASTMRSSSSWRDNGNAGTSEAHQNTSANRDLSGYWRVAGRPAGSGTRNTLGDGASPSSGLDDDDWSVDGDEGPNSGSAVASPPPLRLGSNGTALSGSGGEDAERRMRWLSDGVKDLQMERNPRSPRAAEENHGTIESSQHVASSSFGQLGSAVSGRPEDNAGTEIRNGPVNTAAGRRFQEALQENQRLFSLSPRAFGRHVNQNYRQLRPAPPAISPTYPPIANGSNEPFPFGIQPSPLPPPPSPSSSRRAAALPSHLSLQAILDTPRPSSSYQATHATGRSHMSAGWYPSAQQQPPQQRPQPHQPQNTIATPPYGPALPYRHPSTVRAQGPDLPAHQAFRFDGGSRRENNTAFSSSSASAPAPASPFIRGLLAAQFAPNTPTAPNPRNRQHTVLQAVLAASAARRHARNAARETITPVSVEELRAFVADSEPDLPDGAEGETAAAEEVLRARTRARDGQYGFVGDWFASPR